ncbi:2060_t:CDS:2 [Dentiscutata erythropus]|uniref:2060_t:CDS:1 n=1 Tax=Dentiscutata erythropus TaxID=1348616 RepID=A0A9N8ZJL9_9GLOM|nr:2060_t:CDS:2 [Dentiscutata erythropus]
MDDNPRAWSNSYELLVRRLVQAGEELEASYENCECKSEENSIIGDKRNNMQLEESSPSPKTFQRAPRDMSPLMTTIRNPTHALDLRSLIYVEAVNSNLICYICQTPFIDPVVIESCGSCISQAIKSRPTCPVDRSRLSDVSDLKPVSEIIFNMVNELLVYCPNKKLGCNYQGQRQLLSCHFKEGYMYTIVVLYVVMRNVKKQYFKKGHCDSCPMKHIESILFTIHVPRRD